MAVEDARALRERYGVPVVGLEVVPDRVTGNRRATGGAADDETIDLDALDLPGPSAI